MGAEPENRVRVEPLEAGDVDRLAALAREIWYAHYPAIISVAQIEYMLAERYSSEVVLAELQRDGVWWDKLTVAGGMEGFASYFLTSVPGEMKLDKLYVHPRLQRRGYGGMMIARAGEVARARGCSRLVLAVNKNNRSAIDAYLKHGFHVTDAAVKDIGGGFVMDDYIMVKAVTGDQDSLTRFENPGVEERCALLRRVKTIAVVGLSPNPARPSYGVSQAMQGFGYTIVPVHPTAHEILGARVYPRLGAISVPIDLVNVFRRPEFIIGIVNECLELGLKNIWIQEGIVNVAAARKALEGGMMVVMDRCIYRDYLRYYG